MSLRELECKRREGSGDSDDKEPSYSGVRLQTMGEGYCLDWGFKSGLRVEGLSSGAINTGETNLTNLRFSKEKMS